MSEQRQRAGDASTNVQVAGDLVLGLTEEQALALFEKNFVAMQGQAMDTVRARVEEMMSEFLSELQARQPERLGVAADPDVQMALYNAQRGYACSGEEDLRKALLDMLVDRTGAKTGQLEAIVLNEAIVTAPKLTADQRRAVAACFITRYTRWLGPPNLDAFYEMHVRPQIAPLAGGLPRHQSAYQHIGYVGAGDTGIGSVELFAAIFDGGWGTAGFLPDEVPDVCRDVIGSSKFFIPSIRDPARLQVAAMHQDELDSVVAGSSDEQAEAVRGLFGMGRLSPEQLEEEALAKVPELRELVDTWRESMLKNLTLTSVGLAIGHGYWTRLTGGNAPLSIWLT